MFGLLYFVGNINGDSLIDFLGIKSWTGWKVQLTSNIWGSSFISPSISLDAPWAFTLTVSGFAPPSNAVIGTVSPPFCSFINSLTSRSSAISFKNLSLAPGIGWGLDVWLWFGTLACAPTPFWFIAISQG